MTVADEMARLSPRQTAGVAPPRRPGSIRRTSTIDVSWPEGAWANMLFDARARDVVTPPGGGAPKVCAEDSYVAAIDSLRTIVDIRISPARPAQDLLIGHRGGSHLRKALDQIMPEERVRGTPLYLILDDISGASLVSGWAWSRWNEGWLRSPDSTFDEESFVRGMEERVGICVGFAPGASVHALGANRKPSSGAPAPDLRNPDDALGWHAYSDQTGVGMRRARRIDVGWDGDRIVIDAAFQDSGTRPGGGRTALHEYSLFATVNSATMRIETIGATPHVLPFPECPGATGTLSRLIGEPLSELRKLVPERLRGAAGCTHLNDALRALAEVPHIVAKLERV